MMCANREQKSYASDYLGFVILLVLYLNLQIFVVPFHRLFYLDDHRIQFPHAEVERVPVCKYFLMIMARSADV